jgi:hypothetical protein
LHAEFAAAASGQFEALAQWLFGLLREFHAKRMGSKNGVGKFRRVLKIGRFLSVR